MRPKLRREGVRCGRDRFYEVLKKHGLLVAPPPKSCRTTNSRHSMQMFPNRIKDMEITAANQVWVSDITYVRTEGSFVYLALITDAFSRKIVGYHCGDSLEAIGCISALDRALEDLPEYACPIHHSDRGCQYCCHDYVNRLTERGLGVSMTEINHCAENALAERVNGILKQEYAIGATFPNIEHARAAVEQAIWLYNNGRPHMSLNMKVPEQVHRQAA
ncbi:MAG: IS3 family transposase [bacterium]